MKINLAALFLLAGLAFLHKHCFAAQILSLNSGAKTESLAGAVTASGEDLSALPTNPASLSRLQSSEAIFTQAFLFEDVKYSYLAVALPTKRGVPSFEYGALNYGEVEITDEKQELIRTESPKDYFFGASLSSKGGLPSIPRISAGGSIRYARSDLIVRKENAFALNLGCQYQSFLFDGFKLGFAFQKFGPNLPQSMRFGLAYRTQEWKSFPIKPQYSLDFVFPSRGKNYMALGTQTMIFDLLSIQTGFTSEEGIDNRFRYGFGVGKEQIEISYSVSPHDNLGMAHQLSLRMRFSQGNWSWLKLLAKKEVPSLEPVSVDEAIPEISVPDASPNVFFAPEPQDPLPPPMPEQKKEAKKNSTDNKSLNSDYEKGLKLMEHRNVDEAIHLFKNILAKNRGFEPAAKKLHECLKSRGIHHFSNRNYHLAARDFGDAYRINPADSSLKKFLENAELMQKNESNPPSDKTSL